MSSFRSLAATVISMFFLGGLQAQSITGTLQCKSIVIRAAQGPSSLSVAFTTPSTVTSRNPQLPLNGEFMPSDDPAVQFLSYWVLFNAGTAVDLGILGFGSTAIALDSDANGIPNFAERQLAANVVGDIVAISRITGASSAGTITLSRSAGQETGTAVTRFTSGTVFTGAWIIPILDISGTYDSTQRTFRIRTTSSVFASGTMTGSYTRLSDDGVSFSNIVYRLDAGQQITSTPITFTRFGRTYRAIVQFLDGNILDNTFPDFQRWTLQITDPTDSDGDGIPDLSDGTPTGQSPLRLSYRRETNGQVTLTWTGSAKLTRATAPQGFYTDVANAATGYRFTPTGTSAFYRLRL